MNVLFACYKCRDDWTDDRKLTRLAYEKLMSGSLKRLGLAYEKKVRRIDSLMKQISRREREGAEDIVFLLDYIV